MRSSIKLAVAVLLATGAFPVAAAEMPASPQPVRTVAAEPPARLHRDGSICPLEALRRSAAAGCAHSQEQLAAIEDFNGVGKILCAKCDLGIDTDCRAVFKTVDGRTLHTLCDGDLSEKIRTLTAHGELEVTVHGHTVLAADGDSILCLEGFSVGTI